MLIVRLLRQIIGDLLADPRFKNGQYLSFEMHERNCVTIFGADNGGVWCEKTKTATNPADAVED